MDKTQFIHIPIGIATGLVYYYMIYEIFHSCFWAALIGIIGAFAIYITLRAFHVFR